MGREVFGNQVFVREVLPQSGDNQLQMLAVNLCGDVNPHAIGVVLLEIHSGVLIEEVLHFALPPGRTSSPVGQLAALKVDASLVRIAVELEQHIVARSRVVVDHIDDHRQTGPVGRVDKMRQSKRRPVRRFRGEERRRVVPPRTLQRMFVDGHDLDAIESHLGDISELALEIAKRRPPRVEFVIPSGETADVQLVDDEVVEARRVERRPAHQIVGDDDGGVAAGRIGPRQLRAEDVAGSGIERLENIRAVGDFEAIELPRRQPGHCAAPVVPLAKQILLHDFVALFPIGPILHHHLDGGGMRSPDPEETPVSGQPGANAFANIHETCSPLSRAEPHPAPRHDHANTRCRRFAFPQLSGQVGGGTVDSGRR